MAMASAFMPAAVNPQSLWRFCMPGWIAVVATATLAIWQPGLSLIRDIYSKAASGTVMLTWVGLFDAEVAFRTGAYQILSYKIAP